MKIACYILSLYFLTLTGMACPDTTLDQCSESEISLNTDAHSQDHESSDHQDDCSPLCVCHCCHTHCVMDNTFQLEILVPLDVNQKTAYLTQFPTEYYTSLLEPPRL